MKVAYLLPGFVRKLEYFDEIKKFLELNNNHQIDLYSNTYDVLGAPHKEPADKTGYKNSMRIDNEYIESFLPFKSLNIENYENVDNEISEFSEKHSHLIKKSPSWASKKSRKMGCEENEKTTLRSYYGQVRNIFKTFSMIDDINSYDLIIKSRFDAWVSCLDLDYYENLIGKNTLFGYQYHHVPKLDNGKKLEVICDLVVFGDPLSMNTWCNIDEELLVKIYSDKNLSSKEYEDAWSGSDIKLNMECIFCYNYFVLNDNQKYVKIRENHLPNRGFLPRVKYPEKR